MPGCRPTRACPSKSKTLKQIDSDPIPRLVSNNAVLSSRSKKLGARFQPGFRRCLLPPLLHVAVWLSLPRPLRLRALSATVLRIVLQERPAGGLPSHFSPQRRARRGRSQAPLPTRRRARRRQRVRLPAGTTTTQEPDESPEPTNMNALGDPTRASLPASHSCYERPSARHMTGTLGPTSGSAPALPCCPRIPFANPQCPLSRGSRPPWCDNICCRCPIEAGA